MKRSEALRLIANQIDFLNGTFEGVRTTFAHEELAKADVILTTLEQAGMMPASVYTTTSGEYMTSREFIEDLRDRDEPYRIEWEPESLEAPHE